MTETEKRLRVLLEETYLSHHLRKWTKEFDAKVWEEIKELEKERKKESGHKPNKISQEEN